MSMEYNNTVKSRKVGMEHIVMMRLPSKRFFNIIPPHLNPTVDDKSRINVALLAQACTNNSFDNEEMGPTEDVHLWLQVETLEVDSKFMNVDFVLPSTRWFGLASASNNNDVKNHLQSFGFNPLNLRRVELQEKCGSVRYSEGGVINWNITGAGRNFKRVGVKHEIIVAKNAPHSRGHCISALVSNINMEMLGRVHIRTAAFEPFLFENEKLPAAVHLMNRLEADIIYKKLPNK